MSGEHVHEFQWPSWPVRAPGRFAALRMLGRNRLQQHDPWMLHDAGTSRDLSRPARRAEIQWLLLGLARIQRA